MDGGFPTPPRDSPLDGASPVGNDSPDGNAPALGNESGRDRGAHPGTNWIRVGTLYDIPRLGSRVVETPGEDIAVFRTADDRVFAVHDRCPHKAGKLSQGIVHGTSVTCPLHNWVIGLDDGRAKDPDEGCVRTIPVKLDGQNILLAMPSS